MGGIIWAKSICGNLTIQVGQKKDRVKECIHGKVTQVVQKN